MYLVTIFGFLISRMHACGTWYTDGQLLQPFCVQVLLFWLYFEVLFTWLVPDYKGQQSISSNYYMPGSALMVYNMTTLGKSSILNPLIGKVRHRKLHRLSAATLGINCRNDTQVRKSWSSLPFLVYPNSLPHAALAIR